MDKITTDEMDGVMYAPNHPRFKKLIMKLVMNQNDIIEWIEKQKKNDDIEQNNIDK